MKTKGVDINIFDGRCASAQSVSLLKRLFDGGISLFACFKFCVLFGRCLLVLFRLRVSVFKTERDKEKPTC
jgi:hypothetical protein